MLSGVAFLQQDEKGSVRPEFVNHYVLTDVFLASVTSPSLETPILPSIATLVSPLSSLAAILRRIFRTVLLVVLSHLPGSEVAIKRISVANTAFIYHDGRALATCESGPPMRISLPRLETVGWYTGVDCEGEKGKVEHDGFGGKGLLSFFKEWTTAHVSTSADIQCHILIVSVAESRSTNLGAAIISLNVCSSVRALLHYPPKTRWERRPR